MWRISTAENKMMIPACCWLAYCVVMLTRVAIFIWMNESFLACHDILPDLLMLPHRLESHKLVPETSAFPIEIKSKKQINELNGIVS